jgi:hypothetical protein
MPKKTTRRERPAKSNRGLGRPGARGVFVIFDQPQAPVEQVAEEDPGRPCRFHLASSADGLRVTCRDA